MKRSLKEIADLTSKHLSQENIGRIAKTVWIELQTNKKFASLDELMNRIRRNQADQSKSKLVIITSASELTDLEKEELKKKIEKRVNNSVAPIYKIDRNLLGGIKIRIEDELLDISWRGKLQIIQAKLEGNYE